MRVFGNPLRALAEVRGILFPWVPVFMAIGIGLWFGLDSEPGFGFYAGVLAVLLATAADRKSVV